MLILRIVIGILAALFVYNDAKGRGHKATTSVLWSVGSAVVPFVILPLYLLVGRKVQQRNQYDHSDVIDIEATVVDEISDCAKCGGHIKENYVVCPYCQAPTGPQNKVD